LIHSISFSPARLIVRALEILIGVKPFCMKMSFPKIAVFLAASSPADVVPRQESKKERRRAAKRAFAREQEKDRSVP
jgi:hypothetical protein